MANLFTAVVRPRPEPSEPSDPGEGSASPPAALGPFNRRVRLVVEVLDDPDELELARGVFGAQGWGVRPVEERDGVTPHDGYAGLIVEVPLRSSRWTARSTASEQVRSLAARRKIDAWVREAQLVPPRPEGPSTTYHVHRKVPEGTGPILRWLAEHWIAVGGWDLHHTLHLRGTYSEEQRAQALEELRGRRLGGVPFDPERHDIRRSIGPRPRDRSDDRQGRLLVFVPVGAALLVGFACGITLAVLTTPWRFLALAAPASICWPVGRWMTGNEPRPWLVRLGCGVFFVGSTCVIAYFWAGAQPGSLSTQLRWLGVTLLIGFTLFGLWYALSDSWFSRNVQWFLPVLAAPVPFVLPWAGSFLHAVYLEDFFGIPADTVHVAFYWQYAVALRPLGVAVACVLVLIALAGWARHINWLTGAGGLLRWLLPLEVLIVVLTVAGLALGDVDKAATRTMEDAAAGRRPAAYFGIQGELVCVTPMADEIPVLNGPVPTGHPLLAFQASGDVVWLWDPDAARGTDSARHALRVRAEDVTLTAAQGRNCPADRT
ncbi:hypothetical protein ACIG0D_25700 [Streptomyces sp. NPDC052773]|uniref:hypothetical protein n=1 Tax=Streptomyces sp. NPDC052773 TaxID=3365693 RepID=UPI0037D3A0BE